MSDRHSKSLISGTITVVGPSTWRLPGSQPSEPALSKTNSSLIAFVFRWQRREFVTCVITKRADIAVESTTVYCRMQMDGQFAGRVMTGPWRRVEHRPRPQDLCMKVNFQFHPINLRVAISTWIRWYRSYLLQKTFTQQHFSVFLLSGPHLNKKFLRFFSTVLTSRPTLIRSSPGFLKNVLLSLFLPSQTSSICLIPHASSILFSKNPLSSQSILLKNIYSRLTNSQIVQSLGLTSVSYPK